MAYLGDTIKRMVAAEAEAFGLFLVNDNVTPGNYLLRFYMDSAERLDMEVLSTFTRHISKAIDELELGDKPFTFEISSPGADAPLTDLRQYNRHVGRNFEIESIEDEKFEGKLLSVSGDSLNFERKYYDTEKKKNFTTGLQSLAFDQIKKATIIISFN